MVEVSIIVPIYNVEQYLSRCIESILAQTYTNYELILIDDGSPDNCAKIMEYYSQCDMRILTVHQENRGVSAARNAGLKIAVGKYVCFIDPDDCIADTYLEELVRAIKDTNVEIACCNWEYFYPDGKIKKHRVENIPYLMEQQEFINHLFDQPRTLAGSNCNKLFLRDKIVSLYDEDIKICEDNLFLMKYCLNITSGCYINRALYYIFEREGSATRGNPVKLASGLKVRKEIIEIVKTISRESMMLAEKDFLDMCYLYYKQFADVKELKNVKVELKEYLKQHWGRVLKNRKIYWKTKLLYFITVVK